MSLYGPDRHRFSSRRSKKHALDGSVPGVDYNRRRGGKHFAGTPEESDLSGRVAGTPSPQRREDYDPIRPEYLTAPGYGQPDEWDAIELEPRMPQIRFEFPDRRPKPVQYRNALMSEALFDAMLDRFLDRPQPPAALEQIPFDHDVRATQPSTVDGATAVEDPPRTGLEPITGDAVMMPAEAPLAMEAEITSAIDDAISLGPEPESPVMADPPEDLPMAGFDSTPPDSMDAMADQFAMTLDTLVEQMMPEPALPQPEEPDPYQLMNQAFDQQMQMMDPSNMPGPPGM